MSAPLKRLQRGEPAPDFETTTISGKPFALSDLEGDLVWLIFYRYAGCPICNLHLRAVFFRSEVFEKKKVKVVAVYESPADAFPQDWEGLRAKNFYAISDPERVLYKAYGVDKSVFAIVRPQVALTFMQAFSKGIVQKKVTGSLNQLPASFLISPDGLIDHAYYGTHAADHLPWPLLDQFVKENGLFGVVSAPDRKAR